MSPPRSVKKYVTAHRQTIGSWATVVLALLMVGCAFSFSPLSLLRSANAYTGSKVTTFDGDDTGANEKEEDGEEIADDEARQYLFNGLGHGGEAIRFDYLYIADTFALARGGFRSRGAIRYLGDLEINGYLDTAKMGWWDDGEFFVHGDALHGHSLTPGFVGDFQFYDEYEPAPRATPFVQVTEYWLKQKISDHWTVKIGKQDANRDFIFPEIGAEFVNSSFSLIPTMAPPTYPNCSLGVAAFYEHDERTTIRGGVYDGAFFVGQFAGGRSGFETLGEFGALFLGEVQHRLPWHEQMPSNLRVGAWYHTADFPVIGGPAGTTKEGNHGFYFSGEQMIWREEADEETPQGLSVFGQYAFSPYDRNILEDYVGGGLLYRGLLPGRDQDALGCGVGHAIFSRDSYALRTEHAETAIELFYKAYLTPFFRVQPELQYIASPSGYLPDAFLVGLRVEVAL